VLDAPNPQNSVVRYLLDARSLRGPDAAFVSSQDGCASGIVLRPWARRPDTQIRLCGTVFKFLVCFRAKFPYS